MRVREIWLFFVGNCHLAAMKNLCHPSTKINKAIEQGEKIYIHLLEEVKNDENIHPTKNAQRLASVSICLLKRSSIYNEYNMN